MSSSSTRRAITAGHFRLPRALMLVAFEQDPNQTEQIAVLICPFTRLPARDRNLLTDSLPSLRRQTDGVRFQPLGNSWLLELAAAHSPQPSHLPPEVYLRLLRTGFSPWLVQLAEQAVRRQCRALLLNRPIPMSPK